MVYCIFCIVKDIPYNIEKNVYVASYVSPDI